MGSDRCCSPSGKRPPPSAYLAPQIVAPQDLARHSVSIDAGHALVGTDTPYFSQDGEGPLRRRKIKAYRIAPAAVTNAEFAAFVAATGYVTEAERFGWSFVFWEQVPDHIGATQAVQEVQWWRRVDGANWRNINGPETEQKAWNPDHPVVQVSWNDAQAYAKWAGGRLPSEAEWEHAARAGLGDVPFGWGDAEPNDADFFPCNIYQGRFPDLNTARDGHRTTAPAYSFSPNAWGLYNMLGNVWEWTAEPFRVRSLKRAAKLKAEQTRGYRLLKGGSFLCHKSYCYRYRIAARTGNSADSTTTHQGFRMVWDV